MSTILRALLFPLLLCTCGPAQDVNADVRTEESILRAEKVFTEAYENLDAAIIERLLTDDFELQYATAAGTRSRAEYVSELAEMRAVFPKLQLTVDTFTVTELEQSYQTSGERTFSWQLPQGRGAHTEQFINYWRPENGELKLYRMEIATRPAGDAD
jgi:hypothetical protein